MAAAFFLAACSTRPRVDDSADGGGDTSDSDTPGPVEAEVILPQDTETTPDLVPGWRLAWAKRAGGLGWDDAVDISAVAGFVDITGCFSDYAVFGEGEENETPLWGEGGYMFLARYELDGSLEWVVYGGDSYTIGTDVDAHHTGYSVVTGFLDPPGALFGDGEEGEIYLETSSWRNAFLARFGDDGSLTWARSTAAPEPWCSESDDGCHTEGEGVSVFEDGTVVVSGQFKGRAVFGEGTANETVLTSAGQLDAFLARYDAEGGLVWARCIGGLGDDGGDEVAALPDGTFYLLGTFSGSVVFGEGESGETSLNSAGTSSAFLSRHDGEGHLIWAVDLGIDGGVNKEAGKIVALPGGDVAVSGRFSGEMVEGPGEGDSIVETPEGGRGMFVARYTADGERIWNSVDTCTEFYGAAWSVAALADESVAVAGRFEGTAVFGEGEENETVLEWQGGEMDGYVAVYRSDGSLDWGLGQGGTGLDSFSGVAVVPDGAEQESIILAGRFNFVVTFGTGGGDEIELTSADEVDYSTDIVLLRFDVQTDVD
jgi:hypothetical protein